MRHFATVLAVVAVTAATLGLGLPAPAVNAAGGATVTIPGDMYTPAVVVIEVGQAVTWVNKDSDKHTAVAAPGAPEAFSVPAFPGNSVSRTFTKAGVYSYLCDEHATFDRALHRATARRSSDMFPIAMEGLIIVKGPGLTGASEDSIAISNGNIAPDFTVIKTGGKVTWKNDDKDRVLEFPGSGVDKIALPAGKSGSATFAKPGVYLFYDSNSATFDQKLGLAKAKSGTKTFPVSMQGFVIVL